MCSSNRLPEDSGRRLEAQGKAKSYSPAPGKLLRDLGARKVQVKLSGHAVFVTVLNPTFVDQHVPVEHDLSNAIMLDDTFCPRCVSK